MTNTGTIGELIAIAIQAEKNIEALYNGFAQKFADYPEIATFWSRYAGEELGHAKWIAGLPARVDAERLAAPADAGIFRQAQRLVNTFSLEDSLAQVRDLQDAYELANELEHSETNSIFEFLIAHFAEDANTLTFLRAQLRDHVARLMIDFPNQFKQVSMRRAIRVAE